MLGNNEAFSSFSVDNVSKAKKFYSETLGLQVSDVPEMNGMFEIHVGNGYRVLAYEKPNHTPATFTILNFTVNNIDDAVNLLNDKGVGLEIYDEEDLKTDSKGIMRGNGPTVAWFKDPAGNIISIIEKQ